MKFNKKIKVISIIVFVLLILLLNVYLYIKYNETKKSRFCKDCNVILISIDTLAATHLPCYGYERNTAPNLCEFAKNNVYFSNSYSNSHWTLPSHISIFTSLYSTTHGVLHIIKDKLNTKYETLPQLFKNNGYKTIYSGPNDDPYLPLDLGIGRGFDDRITVTTAKSNKIDFWDKALEMFKKNNSENKPTFMFLHTYAVHDPYLPEEKETYQFVKEDIKSIPKNINDYYYYSPEKVEKLISFFEDRIKNSDTPESLNRNTQILKTIKKYNKVGYYDILDKYLTTELPLEKSSFLRDELMKDVTKRIDYYRDLYDECIYDLDINLKKVFDLVKDESIARKTIIIITSDHGEEFWEHSGYGHSIDCPDCLYSETIKVPMIMYIPGLSSKKIDGLIQGIDIYPTVADMTGIKYPKYLEGKSMLGQIYGDLFAKKDSYVISESNLRTPQKVIIDSEWKLNWKYDQEKNNVTLYNLINDPEEKNNVADANKDIVENRLKKLNEFMARANIDKSNKDNSFPSWVDKTMKKRILENGYF